MDYSAFVISVEYYIVMPSDSLYEYLVSSHTKSCLRFLMFAATSNKKD